MDPLLSTILIVAVILVTALLLSQRRPLEINIHNATANDNGQAINGDGQHATHRVTDVEGRRRTTNTNKQVCEDTLANLIDAWISLSTGAEIIAAAEQSRFNGDACARMRALLDEVKQPVGRAILITRLGRAGEYYDGATEAIDPSEVFDHA
jgi:hypothetical protein